MDRGTDAPGLEEHLCEILEAYEHEGDAAAERAIESRPEWAAVARERVAELRRLGLLGGPAEPREGRQFGSYRLVGRLGEGGMGVVELGFDERLARPVALKRLSSSLSGSQRHRQRFEREGRALAAIDHPGLVQVYEVGDVEGQPYIAMGFLEGDTLAAWVARLRAAFKSAQEACDRTMGTLVELLGTTALPQTWSPASDSYPRAIARIGAEIAEALHAAHEAGVVHRDVKPSNIMIAADGSARVFDFGLALVDQEQALTLTADLAGTPYYASPEQLRGDRDALGPATDVYSLGVTLFELLALEPPFRAPAPAKVVEEIERGSVPLLRGVNASVPRDLEVIVSRALEREPAARYPSAAAFAEDLRAFLAGEPIVARPVSAPVRFLRSAARRPARTVAALSLALVAIGTPVGLWIANRAITEERILAERAKEEAEAQRDRANAALERATETARFFESVIFGGTIDRLGPNAPLMTILDDALHNGLEGLDTYPVLRADLLTTLGSFYLETGGLDRCEELILEALRLYGQSSEAKPIDVAVAWNFLGNVRAARTDFAPALEAYERSIEEYLTSSKLDRRICEPSKNRVDALIGLGRLEEAEQAVREHRERLEGLDVPETYHAQLELSIGRIAEGAGDLERARAAYTKARDIFFANHTGNERGVWVGAALSNLARLQFMAEDYEGALASYREQLDLIAGATGGRGVMVGQLWLGIGMCEVECGRAEPGLACYRKALELLEEDLGPDNPMTRRARTLKEGIEAQLAGPVEEGP